jgi:hypothetical protein
VTKLTTQVSPLLAVVAAILPLAFATPAAAASQPVAYVSSTGNDQNSCTATQPCLTVPGALEVLGDIAGPGNGISGIVSCIDGTGPLSTSFLSNGPADVTIDCPIGQWVTNSSGAPYALTIKGNQTYKIRHVTFNLGASASGASAIIVQGSGNLILEDCVIENSPGVALTIEPTGAFNLALTNTRLSNNGAAGVLIQPASGGSVTATFDHVRITENSGGGIHADSSNGPVTVDVVDSVISDNSSNGFNVTSGSGTQNNVVTLSRSTIATNGLVGIQVGGSNAAVLVDTTLLDSNTNGATYVGSGGRILSYGNNRIVGSSGSGFTGAMAQQ